MKGNITKQPCSLAYQMIFNIVKIKGVTSYHQSHVSELAQQHNKNMTHLKLQQLHEVRRLSANFQTETLRLPGKC